MSLYLVTGEPRARRAGKRASPLRAPTAVAGLRPGRLTRRANHPRSAARLRLRHSQLPGGRQKQRRLRRGSPAALNGHQSRSSVNDLGTGTGTGVAARPPLGWHRQAVPRLPRRQSRRRRIPRPLASPLPHQAPFPQDCVFARPLPQLAHRRLRRPLRRLTSSLGIEACCVWELCGRGSFAALNAVAAVRRQGEHRCEPAECAAAAAA